MVPARAGEMTPDAWIVTNTCIRNKQMRRRQRCQRAAVSRDIHTYILNINNSSLTGKANAVSSEEVKKLQLTLNEKEKMLAKANQDVKATADDAAIKEKELRREVERLSDENKKLISEGTAQLAVNACTRICESYMF
jgi:hypothetical protein